MHIHERSPSIVPPETNQDTYLVLDDFGVPRPRLAGN